MAHAKTQERQLKCKRNRQKANITSLKQMMCVKTHERQMRRKRNSQNAKKINLNKMVHAKAQEKLTEAQA